MPFGGVIKKEKASESKPWWPPRVVPPKGAPNVLLIMTDDDGFGAPSTFGGVIPTPVLDRIAAEGLRYTNFHSTSLCSPTRAAIITGRNHHSEGFGVVGEIATGFPGYDSIIPIDKGTIGTILKANGYATSWFGKDHNTPFYQSSQAGPFDQWPNGMGFDYFYGFVGGDASQWQPNLFRNTTAIYPFQGNPGWNLETAMADEAIQYMKQLKEIAPHNRSSSITYRAALTRRITRRPSGLRRSAPCISSTMAGTMCARPSSPTKEARHHARERGNCPRGRMDRRRTAARSYPSGNLLSWDEKKLFIKQADVYGAYLAYTDHEIGRVIQAVEDLGERDNTLIIYISGDNGASAEGMLNARRTSSPPSMALPCRSKTSFYWYPFWGSERTYPHFAAPVGVGGDTHSSG